MNEKPKLKKMSGDLMEFIITPPKLKSKRRTNSFLLVLKSLACVLGPLTVPTIIYGVEGCTTLFWWTLGIASITSLLLVTFDIQKVKNLIEYLKFNQCGGIRCLIKVGLMILVCGVTTYSYHIHFYEIFSVCLFVAGIITGTFFSDISTWWNFRSKKNLPYVNFTKDSPKPVRPSFLDLKRNSLSVPSRDTNLLPLKRQLSSPTKQSSNPQTFEEARSDAPMSAETPTVPKTPVMIGYPSLSSSSCEFDAAVISQQPMITTPTKRRIISAGSISLSPLLDAAETSPISKRRFEFPENDYPSPLESPDMSHPQTPTFIYTNCNVEGLLSQNFSLFHL